MIPPGQTSLDQERDRLLAGLAEEAAKEPRWSHYAAFCRERVRGLRDAALEEANAFVDQALAWTDDERRIFAEWLCVRLEPHPDVARFATPQPMVERLLQPVLRRWTGKDLTDPRPHRWLGLLFASYRFYRRNAEDLSPVNAKEHLRKAIAIDREEQVARIHLVELLLEDMLWDTHHLPKYYIGDPAMTLEVADEALAVADGIADAERRDTLHHAVSRVRQLVQDWIDFKKARHIDFVGWCLVNGRSPEWVRAYYFRAG